LTPQLVELFVNVAFNVAWGVRTSTGRVKTRIFGVKITKRWEIYLLCNFAYLEYSPKSTFYITLEEKVTYIYFLVR